MEPCFYQQAFTEQTGQKSQIQMNQTKKKLKLLQLLQLNKSIITRPDVTKFFSTNTFVID